MAHRTSLFAVVCIVLLIAFSVRLDVTLGVSTDGQLSYGVVFEEDTTFPWDAEEFDGDIEEWWKQVNGYDNPHYCPFTDAGEYKDDAPVTVDQFGRKSLIHDDPRVAAYYDFRREWVAINPVPIEVVNYCSGDCPMYLLAAKHIECSRGYPQEIDPAFLDVSDDEKQRLREFLERFGIEADEPKWWLTSYWG